MHLSNHGKVEPSLGRVPSSTPVVIMERPPYGSRSCYPFIESSAASYVESSLEIVVVRLALLNNLRNKCGRSMEGEIDCALDRPICELVRIIHPCGK